MVKGRETPVGGLSYFNEPRKLSKEDYRNALRGIIGRYTGDADIAAVYDWGNPSQPGISDLDLVFVMGDDERRPLPLFRRSFMLLDGKTRYIARHPFLFITESGFGEVAYVYPSGKLRLVHGKRITGKALTKEEEGIALRAVLCDIVIRHYPRDFLGQQLSGRINVRDSMLRLNSLTYTFEAIAKITKKRDREWEQFAKSVRELRGRWFAEKDFSTLASLCGESIPLMMDIIEQARELMEIEGRVMKGLPGNIAYTGIKNRALFVRDWEKGYALERMTRLLKEEGRHTSVLPMELAPQLLFYAQQQGRISRHIKSHLNPMVPVSLENNVETVLAKRIGVLNGQAELAHTLRHSDFPAFFDFGYRNTSGINNMLLRMTDKVRF
ncbi:TPA: hypothetical protein HA295_01700 [Candidatus Woesearchaeota archaeon]|nr:hypothetical protein [Candidatus Woesearchaeota archaeon]